MTRIKNSDKLTMMVLIDKALPHGSLGSLAACFCCLAASDCEAQNQPFWARARGPGLEILGGAFQKVKTWLRRAPHGGHAPSLGAWAPMAVSNPAVQQWLQSCFGWPWLAGQVSFWRLSVIQFLKLFTNVPPSSLLPSLTPQVQPLPLTLAE